MGPKFMSETPRWRRNEGEPTREATFSFGRMMNGVGGSVLHWGAGSGVSIPTTSTTSPTCARASAKGVAGGHYAGRLARFLRRARALLHDVEYLIGVAGRTRYNPFIRRKNAYPCRR